VIEPGSFDAAAARLHGDIFRSTSRVTRARMGDELHVRPIRGISSLVAFEQVLEVPVAIWSAFLRLPAYQR
jgi:hypothetical protein